ncbi:hypothetical protein QTP70_000479 [Hemibagrus guttatus]|uniref:Uncharacterized protein n=1 Tax=Hemibagrus guttatus TaxID=175788 RepID=A0AAE0QIX6_9TELE|nr:hypothetical protein QTP70_000479 [Hemibagrus guttatus]
MEMWLSNRVPDAAIQLDVLTAFHADKNAALCAYRPLVRRSKPVLKQVKTWPEGAISALQDCFECTDWDMFRKAATNGDTTDLEEYTSSVNSYFSKCIDDVTISKSITTRSNQKPWMTAKVRVLMKSRVSAFRVGDKDALRTAWAKLSRAIREAKRTHSQRIHGHFQSSGDTRRMWQSIQSITNYRPAPPACDSDASLPDALNSFYAQFEALQKTSHTKGCVTSVSVNHNEGGVTSVSVSHTEDKRKATPPLLGLTSTKATPPSLRQTGRLNRLSDSASFSALIYRDHTSSPLTDRLPARK